MKNGRAVRGTSLVVVAVLLVTGTAVWAQTGTGQISGTVQDTSGGVIVGATVKVISERDRKSTRLNSSH